MNFSTSSGSFEKSSELIQAIYCVNISISPEFVPLPCRWPLVDINSVYMVYWETYVLCPVSKLGTRYRPYTPSCYTPDPHTKQGNDIRPDPWTNATQIHVPPLTSVVSFLRSSHNVTSAGSRHVHVHRCSVFIRTIVLMGWGCDSYATLYM